jgi:deazaflavin-dependent oxidoreductase (nitroreductase family)
MTAVNDYNRTVIDEFRANDGKLTGGFADLPMLLLTTTGAKSGRQHTTPVAYLEGGAVPESKIAVFASKGGAPTNPAWFHNLRANPEVTVELPGEKFAARAGVAEGDEREAIWSEQKSRQPGFAEYEQKTTRTIPVVLLERVS